MMKKLLLIIVQLYIFGFLFGTEFYVSTGGDNSYTGDFDHPLRTMDYAITKIDEGDTLYMMAGTYNEAVTITILSDNNGQPGKYKNIWAYNNDTVILDFSTMTESSSNRGIQLFGDYWHLKGLIIQGAGDNGLMIGGNNNIVENCIFRQNHDTGLQISRMSSTLSNITDWPADNLILNCESYDNSDSDHEDADGFAAKLTCGPGNMFQNCVSHHNIDDGWDLYTKSATGPIGPVTLIECIAHSNGSLTDGSTSGNGDKNGFKLGGEDIAVDHIVRRCVAFNNGKHGFTYNRNLGTIEMTNCSAYQNSERNFNFDGGTSVFNNNLSYLSGSNDRIIGTDMGNNVWANGDPLFTITAGDFVSLLPGDDNAPYNTGFLQLKEGSQLIDKGAIVDGISYQGTAPDLGAFEYGAPIFANKYILTISVNNETGGTVLISPEQSLYDSGSVVTIMAVPETDYYFEGWTGDYSGTEAEVEITMNGNKNLVANFNTDKLELDITSTGPGTVEVNPDLNLYTEGTAVTITAAPYEDCYFIGWKGDTASDENPLSLIIEENINIIGMFQKEPSEEITIQFESSDICEAGGSVDDSHSGFMGTGFFDFTNATGAGIQISVDSKEATTCNLTVRYALGKDEQRPMEIRVNGITQLASVDFPYTGAFTTWDSVSFSLELEKGNNHIDFISLGSEGGANFDQVRLTTSDPLISIGYCVDGPPVIEEYTLNVTVSPSNGGEVTVNPSGNLFEDGTMVNLTAMAGEGFHFTGWSNGEEDASITISMTSDISLTANFEEITGIFELTSSDIAPISLKVYPNPVSTHSVLEIMSSEETMAIVSMVDITGRKYYLYKGMLYKDNMQIINLNSDDYSAGIYFIEVTTEKQSFIEKIRIE